MNKKLDSKTLADVQPGGMVRLGDQAELDRFEEWYVQNAFDYEANPIGSRDCALMRKAWNAALSARQPVTVNESDYVDLPDLFEMGRQPVDPECGHIDPSWSLHDRVEFALRDAGFDLDEAAFVAESVSAQQNAAIDSFARQPVTMDDALAAGDGTLHGAIDHWQERALRAEAELAARQTVVVDLPESLHDRVEALREVAARQTVGAPVFRLIEAIEGECDGLAITPEAANKILAYVYPAGSRVVAYLVDGRVEQGLTFDRAAAEAMAFSNAGEVKALTLMHAAPNAQTGDLGQFRVLALDLLASDRFDDYSPDMVSVARSAGNRLLALIDSQA